MNPDRPPPGDVDARIILGIFIGGPVLLVVVAAAISFGAIGASIALRGSSGGSARTTHGKTHPARVRDPTFTWSPNSTHTREAHALLSRVMNRLRESGRFAAYANATYACSNVGTLTTCSLTKQGRPPITVSGRS